MSKTRYDWWSYVKGMIRRYPDLRAQYQDLHMQSMALDMSGMPKAHFASRTTEDIAIRTLPSTHQREYEAVAKAISITQAMQTGKDRLALIRLVFWAKSHTLAGAAQETHISYTQAQRYHAAFIMLVAANYGLLDK